MNAKQRIERLINRKSKEGSFKLTSYILCKSFGWDYYTLREQPLPFIWDMIEGIEFEAKQMEKEEKNLKKRPIRSKLR